MDKSALNRATDSSTAPTPGYLYNDISKTLTSPQTCVETLNYLLSRLSKNNPHIKRKALKVLAKISGHPASRGMMKRCVVQNPNAISQIKEGVAYRGAMDAVTGDQYNVEVREAAKECLEVVYSDAGEMSAHSSGGGMGSGGGGQLQGGGMAGLGSNSNAGMGGYGNSNSGGGGYGGQGGGGYGAPIGGTAPGSGHSGSGMGSSGGGGRMEGIGNPMFSDPRSAQNENSSKLGQLGSMAANVGGAMLDMVKDPLAKNVETVPGRGGGSVGGYNPNARPDPYAQPPPGRNNLAMQTGGQWTMASNRGPNAVGSGLNSVPTPPANNQQNSEYYKARNAQGGHSFQWAASGGGAPAPTAAPPAAQSGVGGSWASAPMGPPAASQMSVAAQARQPPAANVASAVPITGNNGYGNTGGAAVGGGIYEKNLILELCPPGGMKAEPPQDKLEEFARSIPSLNPDLICPALLDALEEGNPWIMRAKALCVIETVLKVEAQQSDGGGVQAYTDFFHACAGEIAPLANHARASVKGPAKRVLAELGMDGTGMMMNGGGANHGVAAAVVPHAAAAPVAPPTNLLDFDEPAPVPVAAPPPVAPPAPSVPVGGGDSLFSGLNTKAGSAPSMPPVAAPAPPSAAPPAPAVAAPQQQNDFFGGAVMATSNTSAPAVASGSNDLFGNMTLKSAEATVENAPLSEPVVNAAPPPGSAFGFMNATTPASPVPQPPAAPVMAATPTSPPTKSFDPLLSMGMNGNNNMTNNTPVSPNPNMAQMQQMQMAYQQNMMMMQMQQMQMAQAGFQRQGSSGGVVPGMPPTMPNMNTPNMTQSKHKPIMGANYMRQVPGVGDNTTSSFSFLGSGPVKKDNKSFDFVKDAMKKG